jgi:uncharacterized protein YdeI (YjbR/CyaY-like superfamily)
MQQNTKWSEELHLLGAIIEKAGLDKAVKWGADVYTYQGKNVISYGGFKNYFALWFYNGVFLNDPYRVLVNAQEGKTKSLRQWRFTSKAEIDEKKILEYIREAVAVEQQGKAIKPAKFTPAVIPDWMQREFAKNTSLKSAFDQLTPGKQKEFVEHVDSAKKEETRMARWAKVKPMILAGAGLNDKYKKGF